MNFRDALIYIRERSDYERGFISNPFAGDDAAAAGLERTRFLLDALGSPDRAYPIIHVAGTKGKGSTCAFAESVARHAGLKTGMFATPQLHSIRERTLIEGQPISEVQFASTMARVSEGVEQVEAGHPEIGGLTAFEISTAQSLLAFADAAVELAIVEVGLGGRLDATNVVQPVVAVITPISFDHQAILGDTLAEIAGEKAGIIKSGVPVVVGPQEDEARLTIAAVADERGAPLLLAGIDWLSNWSDGLTTLAGPWGELTGVDLGLAGAHQAANAGSALMALWTAEPDVFRDASRIEAGLEEVSWPGRFERNDGDPIIVLDGAHNTASIEVLIATLQHEFGAGPYTVILGSYRDKDLGGMLTSLAPLAPEILATRSKNPRARDAGEIADAARERGLNVVTVVSVSDALDSAIERAAEDTIIVVTGSFSVVAEAREHLALATVSPDEREVLTG